MKHHFYTAALALTAAGLFAPTLATPAAAGDPTGIWMKPDSERPARIEVKKCGGTKLCAKIIWLENPKDSRGNPLRDVRNSNPSQRGRTILGLPLFSGFAPSGPNAWAGQIYNPEDGNTYSATLTLVSHKQITLKGCKAFGLLCGQKTWVRSTVPGKVEEPIVTPTEQIEARAEPKPAPKPAAAPAAEVASAPAPVRETKPGVIQASVSQQEILKPEMPASYRDASHGYGFVTTSDVPDTAPPFSSQSPASMFAFTKAPADKAPANETPTRVHEASVASAPATAHVSTSPRANAERPAVIQTAAQTSPTTPATRPKDSKPPLTASAAGGFPRTGTTSTDATATEESAEGLEQEPTAEMDTAVTEARPMTRRERRLLRRARGDDLPWLR